MWLRTTKEGSWGTFWQKCAWFYSIYLVLGHSEALLTDLNKNGQLREEDVADGDEPHGHVTSISVLRSYRRLGLAKRLMVQSRKSLLLNFRAKNHIAAGAHIHGVLRRSHGHHIRRFVCFVARPKVESSRPCAVQRHASFHRQEYREEVL